MKFSIEKPDPLKILASTKEVVENAKFVSIKEQNIDKLSELIKNRFQKGLGYEEMGYSVAGNLENDLQLIFIENAVNFSFWAGKNENKWQIKDKNGFLSTGGWFGLKACFEKGLANNIPILAAKYVSSISSKDAEDFFRGADGTQIPLLQERIVNLHEAGKVLTDKFGGKFINILNLADYDAIEIAKLVINNFPSFMDISVLDNKQIFFYKRAQILAQDINYILRNTDKKLKNIDQLTTFADYKLPQMLRMYNLIEYNNELAERVDNFIEIPHDSREEIEIRSATIWSVELLRQKIGDMAAADIDNTIWLLSQDIQNEAKPYHRTRTIFY